MPAKPMEIHLDITRTDDPSTPTQVYYRFDGFNTYSVSVETKIASCKTRVSKRRLNRINNLLRKIAHRTRRRELTSEAKLEQFEKLLDSVSKMMRDYILPKEKDEPRFWGFMKEIETMAEKNDLCLLVRTNDFSLPWWITKSITDDSKYWCTMFAIGIAHKDMPESYCPTSESEISVGIITRPSRSTKAEGNIGETLLQVLDPIEKQFRIKDLRIQNGAFCFLDGEKKYKGDFFGVTKEEFEDIVKNTNFLLYYGHFEAVEDPQDSYFRISADRETIEGLTQLEEDVDEEDLETEVYISDVQHDISEGHLLLGGCSTTSLPVKPTLGSIPEFLFQEDINCKSIIGTICPVFGDETQQFLRNLFSNIFVAKLPLGFALLNARREMLRSHIGKIHWFPFSLWGHPLTVFTPPARFSVVPYLSEYTYSIVGEIFRNTNAYPAILQDPRIIDMEKLPNLEVKEDSTKPISEVPIPRALSFEDAIIMGVLFVPIENDCTLVLRDEKVNKMEMEELVRNISRYKICLIGENTSTTLMFRLLFDKWDDNNLRFAEEDRIPLFNQGEFDGIMLTPREAVELDRRAKEFPHFRINDLFTERFEFRVPGPLLIVDRSEFLSNREYFKILMMRYNAALENLAQGREWEVHKPVSLFTEETPPKDDLMRFSKIIGPHLDGHELVEEDLAYYYF